MKLRRTSYVVAVVGALVLTAATVKPRPAEAFSGNDPVNGNPWYHVQITENAAQKRNWSEGAIDELTWHADNIDSYLYNPMFWLEGGLSRFKVAMATFDELAKLHFDDNLWSGEVNNAWRRYLSGAMAGLVWAAEHNNINAARNIVGLSLHAIQDYYAHSNWVDDKERRERTWFETARQDREQAWLYTGTYELPDHLGIAHHGKISPACTLMQLQGVETLLDIGCVALSPLSNSAICHTFHDCQDNGVVSDPELVVDVPVPGGILYLHPPGIALDSPWLAEVAVEQRGVTDIGGRELFDKAIDLATESSVSWLDTLEEEMIRMGFGEFWQQVKTNPRSTDVANAFEAYDQFPYQFLSAGPYPDAGEDTQWFLRVTLKTSDERSAGTDANIDVIAGGRRFRLDYLPEGARVLRYNDFETGDHTVYTIGPFASLPDTIRLENRAPDSHDIIDAFFSDLGDALDDVLYGVGEFLLSIIAGNADLVDTSKRIWRPQDLAMLGPQGQTFTMDVDGGGEGHYVVHGVIRKTHDFVDEGKFEISLTDLECIRESEWDRGSDSDEPFILAVLLPIPGGIETTIHGPYGEVDDGEWRQLGGVWRKTIPHNGGLALAVQVMEHDDESSGDRHRLLREFANELERSTSNTRQHLGDAIGSSLSPSWKLEHIHVYAFSRGESVHAGTVLDRRVDTWIGGNEHQTFSLDESPPVWVQDMKKLEQDFPVTFLVALLTGTSLL